MELDGQLISELGVKRYLKGRSAQSYANINPLQRPSTINKKWEECNFGCHGPKYRVMTRELSYQEFLSQVDKLSPLVAGGIDGVKHELLTKPQRIAAGAQRTAEGLGASGKDVFAQVGAENMAAYNFVTVNVSRLLNTEFSLLDNPLTQLIFTIVDEYISLLPESMLASMINEGAIIAPDVLDRNFVLSAVRYGLTEAVDAEQIDQAANFLSSKGQRFVGKQVGKKVTRAVAVIIAVKITKKIMLSPGVSRSIKNKISTLRKTVKSAKGNMGTALVTLLQMNGWLGIAAAESRQLQADCPTLWKHLRYTMGGFDMMLFLVRGFVSEYLDRIAVLEKNPQLFLGLMASLAKEGKTREIFFPR